MIQSLFSKRATSFFRLFFPAAILLLISFGSTNAQTTISTTGSFTNDTTVNTVTFNFQNTNPYPIAIKSIDGILADYGQMNVSLWYKASAINSNPGSIATANGWTTLSAATVSGISNTTDNITQPFFSGLNLVIPANTTYGIAVSATGISSGTLRAAHGLSTFSIGAGGCNIISDANSGYAGMSAPPAAPTFSPVGWLGKITFAPVINCTGTPAAATISGPAAICANAMFTLTSSAYAAGMSIAYQWQKYNTTTLAWEDIASETNAVYTNTIGITASTQFRLKTSCTTSSTPAYSNILTVSIGAGLSGGVYTINNNAQSTATNFVSFNAAAAAMKCGITGPITINVDPASGPYTEQVFFNNIPGTNAVNKIRINGNGRIVQYYSVDTNSSILRMNGTRYMTLDSLTIRSLSTYLSSYANKSSMSGVSFGDSASYDSLTHCFVDMRSLSGGASGAGIALLGYYASSHYSTIGNCYIGYNHVLGSAATSSGIEVGILNGYWGNYAFDTVLYTGNVIDHNVLENFASYGIMTNGNNGTVISYNDIHRTNKATISEFSGIFCWFGSANNINDKLTIIGNRIHNPSISTMMTSQFFGIRIVNDWNGYSYNNNNNTSILIANNAFYNINSSTTTYCIHYENSHLYNNAPLHDTLRIYHNTFDLGQTATSGVSYGLFSYTYSYPIQNNSYAIFNENNIITFNQSATSGKFGFYFASSNPVSLIMQRNIVRLNSAGASQGFCFYTNTAYPTLASFQSAHPTQEVGSINVDPQYTSATTGNLTPLNAALFNNGLNVQSYVPKDILGVNRSITPTPGAFEIVSDAGVSALLSPLGTYCSGVKMVQVNVHNYGIVNISNVQLNWRLNGVLQTPVAYTGTIAPNGNAAVNLGNVLFPLNTPVIIKAWISIPNGQNDYVNTNDTLTITTQSTTSIAVNIGPDDAICTGNTLTLDAGYPGSAYVWDNAAATQTRTVQNTGTYYVKVTTLDGCVGVDTMHLSLRPLPVVDLGPDVEICEGDTLTFDAGNPGAAYMWDNGATTQTRVIDTAGDYEAQVTDIHGCTGADSVIVTMKNLPMVDAINATHADSGLYTFYPLNPQYIINYVWNFGDGSAEVNGLMVQHQYQHNGIYTVTLKIEGDCPGLVIAQQRTVEVFDARGEEGTGISNTNFSGNITLYPNPAKDMVQIENKSDARMVRVAVYNILGQLIIEQKTDNAMHHQLNTAALANGSYSIRIETDKGMFIQKFEVIK